MSTSGSPKAEGEGEGARENEDANEAYLRQMGQKFMITKESEQMKRVRIYRFLYLLSVFYKTNSRK